MSRPSPRRFPRGTASFTILLGSMLGFFLFLAACSGGSGGGGGVPIGFVAGDTIAGFIHQIPRGSRADVQAKGLFDALTGRWTVEICRLLDTGHEDDAQFVPGQDQIFSMAATDNSGSVHNGATTLELRSSSAGAGSPRPTRWSSVTLRPSVRRLR